MWKHMPIKNSIQLKFDQKKMNRHYWALYNIKSQNKTGNKKVTLKKNNKKKIMVEIEHKRENNCLMKNLKKIYFKSPSRPTNKFRHLVYGQRLFNNKQCNNGIYEDKISKANEDIIKRINSATSNYSVRNFKTTLKNKKFKIKKKNFNFQLDGQCRETFMMYKSTKNFFQKKSEKFKNHKFSFKDKEPSNLAVNKPFEFKYLNI